MYVHICARIQWRQVHIPYNHSHRPRYGVCRIVFEVAAAGDWSSTFEIDVLVQRHLQPLGAGTTEVWGDLL